MVSEENLVRALDLMTIAPKGKMASLTAGARSHVSKMRRVVDTNNVVAVGISEKVTQGTRTGALALTFYVNRKKPLNNLGAHVVPPTVPEAICVSKANPTDVEAIGLPRLELEHLPSPLVTRDPIQSGF